MSFTVSGKSCEMLLAATSARSRNDGRGNGGSFAESITRAEGLQFVGVDRVRDLMEQLAEARITVGVVAAFEHPVDGVVKIAARGFQVAGLVIGFAGAEFFLNLFDQVVDTAWHGCL